MTLGGHPGHLKTLLCILEVAWWPDIRKDTWKPVSVLSASSINHLMQSTQVSEVGEMVGIDIMGPISSQPKRQLPIWSCLWTVSQNGLSFSLCETAKHLSW